MTEPRPYDRTTYDGRVVDWLTRAALEDAAEKLGVPFDLTQGSYSDVDASAGTHLGGGAVDTSPSTLTDARREERALRSVGFAAYVRPELWRNGTRVWPLHVHAILMGNAKLSPAAQAQVKEYLAGGDALAGGAPDTGPRDFVTVRYRWQRGARRIRRARRLLERARLQLATGIRGYEVASSRAKLRAALHDLPKTD